MRIPSNYYEPDVEPDFPYVDEETYYQLKDQFDESNALVYQLIQELYDDCENVDRDIVHEICKKLYDVYDFDCDIPEIKNLKI